MRGLRRQQSDDVGEFVLHVVGRSLMTAARRDVGLATIAQERGRNSCQRKHEIGPPAHDGAARHAIERGLLGVLHDDEAAVLFHRLQAEAAVGAGARQHHADRACAAVLGHRAQEEVERHAGAVALHGLGQAQAAVVDRQRRARRDEINVLAFDPDAVDHLLDLHRGVAGQQIDHQAFVLGIEMLDQHERHAGAGRQRIEEFPEGFEPSG